MGDILTKQLKTHLRGLGCRNHTTWPKEEYEKQLVDDLRQLTCGQCKGVILNALRDKDWATLNVDEMHVLVDAAIEAKK